MGIPGASVILLDVHMCLDFISLHNAGRVTLIFHVHHVFILRDLSLRSKLICCFHYWCVSMIVIWPLGRVCICFLVICCASCVLIFKTTECVAPSISHGRLRDTTGDCEGLWSEHRFYEMCDPAPANRQSNATRKSIVKLFPIDG